MQKKILKQLNDFIRGLRVNKPKAIFIVSGDFNSSKVPIQHMQTLSPDGSTFRRIGEVRALESKTDWVFGANLELVSSRAEWHDDLSDHALIACELSFLSQRPVSSHVKIPCPTRSLKLCALAESKSRNLSEFLAVFALLKKRDPHLRKNRVGLTQKKK